MANLNKVLLIGNVVRDPELRQTKNGVAITNITLAINTKRKDNEETYFASIVAFGKQAELISQYVNKGDPLYCEGRLKRDEWEDSEGRKQHKTTIILEGFQFLKNNSQKPKQNNGSEEDVPF